MAYSCLTVR